MRRADRRYGKNTLAYVSIGLMVAAPVLGQDQALRELVRTQAEAGRIVKQSEALKDDEPGDSDAESKDPLPNFGAVSPGLFRSGQPSLDTGLEKLKAFGVKTILDLRLGDFRERRRAAQLGLVVENVPMSGLWAPSFEQMDRALGVLRLHVTEFLKDPAKGSILVHCAHGKDRTGFVVAAYRVVVEKRDMDLAVQEAKSYRCCFAPFGDLKFYLQNYLRYRAHIAPGLTAAQSR